MLFRDSNFHNLGVGFSPESGMADSGRYEATGRSFDRGRFATPSLLNVALTAPYMHDGSLATLDDVIEFYSRGGNPNPGLDAVMVPREFTAEERSDLKAFLETLTTAWLRDSVAVRARFMLPVPVPGTCLGPKRVTSSPGYPK